ncbi:MAG: radical SAM protein [Deltaproteobacteria bacterium]|nr:radical SAM protein [Candidatus Zymogenaceae bacterium]
MQPGAGKHDPPLPHLRWLYLYLTDGCNLRCVHCWLSPRYVPDTSKQRGLTADDVARLIQEGRPLGVGAVKLTGGEPLMNDEFFRIVEVLAAENVRTTVETNGVLVDEETASFLGAHRVSHVSVSIDSHRSSFHDRFRGVPGALDRSVDGIEHLVAHKIPVQIIMSLTRDNEEDIEGVVRLAEELKAASVKINPVMPVGRGDGMIKEKKNLPVARLMALDRWLEADITKRYRMNVIMTLPSAFKSIQSFFSGSRSECYILNILGVLANGDISICGIGTAVPEMVMGNIRTDCLKDIWETSPILLNLREIVPDGMEGVCGRCLLKKSCLGSCRANEYVLSGSLAAPYWMCREAYERGIFPTSRLL